MRCESAKGKMRLLLANKTGSRRRPLISEQAQIRIVVLALVSFLLGVVATAFWFHLAPGRNAQNTVSQATGEPAAQPAAPVVNANTAPRPLVEIPPPVDATTIAEVKEAIPNFASVSVEQGTQILREAALKQFTATEKEMEVQIQQAQEQLGQAEKDQSAAAQQAAMKHVQQTQAEQTEKLREIALHLQSQIAALKQLKGTAP